MKRKYRLFKDKELQKAFEKIFWTKKDIKKDIKIKEKEGFFK